jgi:hypothetical protein
LLTKNREDLMIITYSVGMNESGKFFAAITITYEYDRIKHNILNLLPIHTGPELK